MLLKEIPHILRRLINLCPNSEVLSWVLLNLFFISIGGIILTGYYNSTTTKPVAPEPQRKFTLKQPKDNTEIKVNDTYDRLIDLKNFTFLINPQTCENYTAGLLLAVIVSSKPDHYELRSTIRNTWGHAHECTKVFFLIAETNEEVDQKIRNESVAHGDIVQGNFADTYRNLTYKHVMGLKWIAHHCPSAKYILKTDDDVFVNTRALRRFLARDLSPWGARGLLAGLLMEGSPVVREKFKWQVSVEEYAGDVYPIYLLGIIALYSQDVLNHILTACQSLPYFWVEDAQVTGVCAKKAGVNHTSISSMMIGWEQVGVLMSRGHAAVGPFIIGPINVNANWIERIWKALSD